MYVPKWYATYDNIDRMLTETNESGTTTYAYSGNNLASITYPDSKSISYEYDIMDNVRKVTDYRNSVFSYRYDPLYNVDDIIQDNRPCVDYYYDVSGALTRTDYRNGSVYYTYDNAMQVTKVKNKWNTTDISEYNYTYDTTGNVKTKSDGTTLTTYTYGLGNRLMSSTDRVTTGTDENGAEVYEETIIDYTYDLDGNLTLKDTTYPASHVHTLMVDGVAENLSSVSRFEQNYFYDNNNRLTKEEDIIIGTPEGAEFPTFYITQVNYTYDNNGNTLTEALTSSSVDEYTKAFTYNKRNQLTGCSKDGTDVASYTYYADGLRRSKTVGTDTTMFYYDRGNIVAEGDGTNITAQNVFGIQGIIKRTEGTTTSHYFKDAHGDTKQIVDGTTGTVTQSYEYDAYGNESDPSATDTNPFRYCGEYYDDETGYIYLRNRYYDPSTQRFITEDPAKDGLNWYAYCSNNPIIYVDPLGLWGENVHKYDTIKWAQEVGMYGPYAEFLGEYDIGTDYGELNPVVGDQSYHFDRDPGSSDTRYEHGKERLNDAIWQWKQADINYNHKVSQLQRNDPNYNEKIKQYREERLEDRKYALKHLGEGLHAWQDIYAHGQIGVNDNIASHIGMKGVDDIDYDWTDETQTNVEKSEQQLRYKYTETMTKHYIRLFFEGIYD